MEFSVIGSITRSPLVNKSLIVLSDSIILTSHFYEKYDGIIDDFFFEKNILSFARWYGMWVVFARLIFLVICVFINFFKDVSFLNSSYK